MPQTIQRYLPHFTFITAVIAVFTLAPINANAENCAVSPGYPLGRWEVDTRAATPATYSTFAIFTTSTSGTWLPANGKGSFAASVAPAPGKAAALTFMVEGNSNYQSENQLVVSPDGCSMIGTFQDSEGHRGEVGYRWKGSAGAPRESPLLALLAAAGEVATAGEAKRLVNVSTGFCLDWFLSRQQRREQGLCSWLQWRQLPELGLIESKGKSLVNVSTVSVGAPTYRLWKTMYR